MPVLVLERRYPLGTGAARMTPRVMERFAVVHMEPLSV
jgi:hypothetical protein